MAKLAVIDNKTHNILGEYPTEEQAGELRDRLVAADPSVAGELEICVVQNADAPDLAAVVSVERV